MSARQGEPLAVIANATDRARAAGRVLEALQLVDAGSAVAALVKAADELQALLPSSGPGLASYYAAPSLLALRLALQPFAVKP